MKKMFKWTVKPAKHVGFSKILCMGVVVYECATFKAEEIAAAHNAQIDMFEHQLTARDVR